MSLTDAEFQKRVADSYEIPNNVVSLVEKPVVTVRTSTYNHGPYIKDCIEGILAQQTNFPFEYIIGEDFSSDETRQIVMEYAAKYPDVIRVVTADYNVGGKINGLRCRLASRGKYSATCEGDDLWTDPLKLQKQVDFIEQDEGLIGCYTGYGFINEDGTPMESKVNAQVSGRVTHLGVLEAGCPKTLTLMVRQDALSGLCDRPERFKGIMNGDQLTCAMATLSGDIGYLPDVTGLYRVGSGFWSTMDKSKQHKTQVNSFLHMAEVFNSEAERLAISRRITKRLAEVSIIQGKECRDWQEDVRNRMVELRLTFDLSAYRQEKRRRRWLDLKQGVRRRLSSGS